MLVSQGLPVSFLRAQIPILFLLFFCVDQAATPKLWAAETDASRNSQTNFPIDTKVPMPVNAAAGRHFNVDAYVIEGMTPVPAYNLMPALTKYAGTNVDMSQLVMAASELLSEYKDRGYPKMGVVIGEGRINYGIVTLNVFEGAFPQIVISGQRYLVSTNGVEVMRELSPEELAAAAPASRANASTNTFEVRKYQILGNTILSPATIGRALTNATGAFGTNVTFTGIQSALTELQQAYRSRGYVTVSVGLPQQKLTNATVKVQVTEGKLAAINVIGNNYFSSNNVARALPSLHTNTLLNGLVFQAELNRANANQDRQIYPVISPGPEPGTSDLTLKIKDRLPLHGKIELNNENSPGTPDLRVNTSAVFNNLWQLEHSLGIQYSFSPEMMKSANQWAFYDRPLVANYSAFYRLPLGAPRSIEEIIENQPGTFGYSEATRKFNLPPPSGQPELNFYASRATIDTGLQTQFTTNLVDVPGVRRLTEQSLQQDITINEVIGFRYNQPLSASDKIITAFSGGLDYKHYALGDNHTNAFQDVEITYDENGNPITHTASDAIPTVSQRDLRYLPISAAYNLTWRATPRLTLTPGLGISANLWHSGSQSNLQAIAGTTNSISGNWVTLTPSLAADFVVYTNWVLSFRANGQWATQPLISNEQFGGGGVSSVRGYHEGEVFGDIGWRVSLEQQTPPYLVGMISSHIPLTIRGSVYSDFAETYLLEPQGRKASTALWGTGFGGIISTGSFWEARLLFSMPLLDAGTTRAGQPFFNFSITGQF